MAEEGFQIEKYRNLLKVQARLLALDPQLHRRVDSSDLVQETLLRAHQHRKQFRGTTVGECVRWLEAILENVVRDRIKEESAQKRDYRREQSLEHLLTDSSHRLEEVLKGSDCSPSDEVERGEIILRTVDALASLPEDQQEVVLLRYLLDLPVAEIARRLERTERSVAGLLFRAVSALRKYRNYLVGDPESEEGESHG